MHQRINIKFDIKKKVGYFIVGKFKDLTGKKFGHLTVVEFAGKNKHRQALWLCNCDCGNEIIVSGGNLTSGNTTSCGCARAKANIGKVAKVKFVGDEMKIAMKHLLDNGLKQHPIIPEFWATPDGQVYIIRENHIVQPSYSLDGNGYYTFNAAVGGNKKKTYKAHRIIAETFLVNNIGHDAFVNHINETKTDNRVANLEFCTREWNANWSCAKSVRAFDQDGNWLGDFTRTVDAADYFGCSSKTVKEGEYKKLGITFVPIENRLKTVQREFLKENDRHDLRYDDISKEIVEF